MPVLAALSPEQTTQRIIDEVVRYLRHVYGPAFNDNPGTALTLIRNLRVTANDTTRPVYECLLAHYEETLQLQDFLEG